MAQGDFQKRNESFVCEKCRRQVFPAKKTSRNHCPFCLYSKHVDIIPGDRKETCGGLMAPIEYDLDHSVIKIIHRCTKCGKIQRNKVAQDDEVSQLLH